MSPGQSRAGSGALGTLALFVSATAINLAAALWLDGRGAFSHIDTLFNADAPWYLRGFVDGSGTGTSWGPRSLVHPNVANLVHPLVAALARFADMFGMSGDPAAIRRAIALAVCPIAAAAETTVIYRVLRPRSADAALLAAIGMVSFSMVIFGATPESFGLTGLGVALLFWALERERETGRPQHALLVVIGAVLMSVTVTNGVPFAIGIAVHRWARGQRAFSLREIALTLTAALCLTAGLAAAIAGAQGRLRDYVLRFEQLHEAPIVRELAGREPRAMRTTMATRFKHYAYRAWVDVPRAFAYSFIPAPPLVITTPSASATDAPIAISFQRAAPDWRRIGPFLVVLGASVLAALGRHSIRPLSVTALALLLFNWGFHTFFGEELLLYSKHWTTAAALLIFTLADGTTSHSTLRRALLLAVLVLLSANTVYVLWRIGHALAPSIQP
jgi:hypothetical protein